MTKKNLEDEVIKNFGEEWELYNQNKISFEEKKKFFMITSPIFLFNI